MAPPELPTAGLRSSHATPPAVDNSKPGVGHKATLVFLPLRLGQTGKSHSQLQARAMGAVNTGHLADEAQMTTLADTGRWHSFPTIGSV